MEMTVLTENSIIFSVTNCVDRACLLFNDTPVILGYGEADELTGERFLDELPALQLKTAEIKNNHN